MTDHPLLDHAGIAARIPHADRMCLLDAVTFWDARRIVCSATSHGLTNHPLRAPDGTLGIAAGIEYAAQAMAVHGSLLAEQAERTATGAGTKPPPGMLASVRAVEMHARRLDGAAAVLQIEATQLAGDAQALVYAFELYAGNSCGNPGESDEIHQPTGDGNCLEPQRQRSLLINGRASVMLVADPH